MQLHSGQHHLITGNVSMVEDEDSIDMQWTSEASAAYKRRAAAFLESLQRHVSQTLSSKGRQAELRQYLASTEELRKAAVAFDGLHLSGVAP